jgi:hypothetical protein
MGIKKYRVGFIRQAGRFNRTWTGIIGSESQLAKPARPD